MCKVDRGVERRIRDVGGGKMRWGMLQGEEGGLRKDAG